jgi:Domain of unknown function (DUF4382)
LLDADRWTAERKNGKEVSTMRGPKAASTFFFTISIVAAALAAGVFAGAGCGHDNDPANPAGQGSVQVQATAPPADLGIAPTDRTAAPSLSSAEVTISEVDLMGDAGGEPVTLHWATDAPIVLDLLSLESGVNTMVTGAQVPAGTYSQLRLMVSGARVTLADGLTFRDGTASMDLAVPSGATSGIKVMFTGPVTVTEQGLTDLILSFDVSRNFVIQGSPDSPQGITGVLFTPTVKEVRSTDGI